MAQNYVGSNNLNLLAPNGQFGTRLMGGEDSASPRYIHTELAPIVRALIKREDDAILEYTEDDGVAVEPETYMPVVPLLLINGALGIGTGFSTNVLPYNPADIVGALRWRLGGGAETLDRMELTPWWFGFAGSVAGGGDGKTWITRGKYEFMDDDAAIVRITELPVGTWTQDYKDFLEEMLTSQEAALAAWKSSGRKASAGAGAGSDKGSLSEKPVSMLRGYTYNCTDVDVDITLELEMDYYHDARTYPTDFEAKFKLTTSHKTSNMVAFDNDGKIHKYDRVGQILEEFYGARLGAYAARKAHELERMAAEIVELTARLTFVRAVVEKRLVVANADDDVLLAGLHGLGLPTLSEGDGLKGYEYLLRMRIDRIKAAAVAELTAELAAATAARDTLAATTPQELWLRDLDEFADAWTSYSSDRRAAYSAGAEAAPAAGTGGKKKAVRRAAKK
jgi:DNA topoisomerase-2